MDTLNARRVTLTAGLWLVVLYSLCVATHVMLGLSGDKGFYHLWGVLLLGFDPGRPVTLILGLLETFVYGALAGWVFASLYNVIPLAPARPSGRPRGGTV